jgi:hypothetical protein
VSTSKARIFKARIADLWIYVVPMPDAGEPVIGWTYTQSQAVRRASILIKAWWHR